MKSSFCTASGCVEVTLKSSFCASSGCVDALKFENGAGETLVMVEDESGDTVVYNKEEWDAFIAGVKNNEFDWEVLQK